ncbi:uncharacterized protein [Hemitrygon akajei]|uniref:uncharacterized protein n=1 Tax=Hemitrygon akajei TaxID=2704970 RepID=UPI003BF9EED8
MLTDENLINLSRKERSVHHSPPTTRFDRGRKEKHRPSGDSVQLAFFGIGLTHLSKRAYSDNGYFSFLSSDTQRILDRMDDSETYMNMKSTNAGSGAPSRDHLTSTYTDLNIRKVERLTNTQADGLDPTYSQLNFRQNETPIAKEENPPMAPRPGRMPMTAEAGPHKQEPNENIGNRPDRKICLLCLVTSVLFLAVVGLSIHVSQIPQSQITRRTCLKNLSALNSNLSDLKRMHSELRHQFTEMETKYRSVNETKAQICELLTSRREQTCPQNWIGNVNRCYFISSLEKPYDGARELCSKFDGRLLEINSKQEENFISISIGYGPGIYWIGKCRDGNVASDLLYKIFYGSPTCSKCDSSRDNFHCKRKHRFICEKSAHLYPDIPEEIQVLCQQPEGDENRTPPCKCDLTGALYNYNVTSARCKYVNLTNEDDSRSFSRFITTGVYDGSVWWVLHSVPDTGLFDATVQREQHLSLTTGMCDVNVRTENHTVSNPGVCNRTLWCEFYSVRV